MNAESTDRIEKSIILRTDRARVWKALANADQFGRWFGAKLDGAFAPGARLTGHVTHEGEHQGLRFELTVERVEPERLLSWRAPFPHMAGDDGPAPTTLIVFELDEVDGGTRLTVTESGFNGIPLAHRAAAYRGNDDGWARQMTSIERYLDEEA